MTHQLPVDATADSPATDLAILPIGSFEQHGDHLPFGTDNYEVEAIAAAVARATGAFLLPVQPISVCYEHRGRRGSMHYSAPVFFRFLVAAGETLYSQGFTRIIFICGHGGVFVLEPAVDHLNAHLPGLQAIHVPAFGNLWDDDTRLTDRQGIHAGEMETALMLHLHPQLVDMARASDYLPDKPQHYLNYGSIFRLTPNGVWGKATCSTPETGRWVFERSVQDCLAKINRSFSGGTASANTDGTADSARESVAQPILPDVMLKNAAVTNLYGADWTLEVLERNQTNTAYLPLAAFGAASPHQTKTADLLISGAFARKISSRVDAFLLPVQPFATRYRQSDRHRLGMDAGLMYDMIFDLAQEISRQGFERLVIQEICSGRSILYSLQRHLNAQGIIKTVLVNPGNLAAKELTSPNSPNSLGLRQDEIDGALYQAATGNHVFDPDQGLPGLLFTSGVQAAAREIEAAFVFMDETGGYA